MTYEFNIGLGDSPNYDGPLITEVQRATDLEKEIAYGYAFKNVTHYRIVPASKHNETTAVFRGELGHQGAFDRMIGRLQQDCVSIYDPAKDEGRLYGPRSDAWPAFDKRFFIRVEVMP